jgi:hypothetical protein
MSTIIPLGNYEHIILILGWPRKDNNLTPWFAEAASIELHGEARDMELEFEAVEHWVAKFRADVLARAVDKTDDRVIIENRFGLTNHGHLGQRVTAGRIKDDRG